MYVVFCHWVRKFRWFKLLQITKYACTTSKLRVLIFAVLQGAVKISRFIHLQNFLTLHVYSIVRSCSYKQMMPIKYMHCSHAAKTTLCPLKHAIQILESKTCIRFKEVPSTDTNFDSIPFYLTICTCPPQRNGFRL